MNFLEQFQSAIKRKKGDSLGFLSCSWLQKIKIIKKLFDDIKKFQKKNSQCRKMKPKKNNFDLFSNDKSFQHDDSQKCYPFQAPEIAF